MNLNRKIELKNKFTQGKQEFFCVIKTTKICTKIYSSYSYKKFLRSFIVLRLNEWNHWTSLEILVTVIQTLNFITKFSLSENYSKE